jgi:hypothetical protein
VSLLFTLQPRSQLTPTLLFTLQKRCRCFVVVVVAVVVAFCLFLPFSVCLSMCVLSTIFCPGRSFFRLCVLHLSDPNPNPSPQILTLTLTPTLALTLTLTMAQQLQGIMGKMSSYPTSSPVETKPPFPRWALALALLVTIWGLLSISS